MHSEKMEKGIKIALGCLVALILVMSFTRPNQTDDPVQRTTPPSPPPAGVCQRTGEIFTQVITNAGGALANPDPGVLVTHPGGWASTPASDKDATIQMLAIQKACAERTNIDYVRVEVRSSTDGHLLASGLRSNIDYE